MKIPMCTNAALDLSKAEGHSRKKHATNSETIGEKTKARNKARIIGVKKGGAKREKGAKIGRHLLHECMTVQEMVFTHTF